MSQRVEQFVAYFRSLRPESDSLKPSHIHILEMYETWLDPTQTPLWVKEAVLQQLKQAQKPPAHETRQQ